MFEFWQKVAATPWWFFLIIGYLIQVGYLATKPRTMTMNHLFIAPFILLTLYLLSMYYLFDWNSNYIRLFLSMCLLGNVLGWIQFKLLGIKAIRDSHYLYVPGTWSLLAIIFGMFLFKYYVDFKITLDLDPYAYKKYASKLVLFFGLFTGLFMGRLIYARRCLSHGPYHSS